MFSRVRALVIKELLAVFRDRRSRLALVVPPFLQLLLFSFTGTQEVKNIDLAVQNADSGQVAHEIVQRFRGSPNFRTVRFVDSEAAMQRAIDRQEVIAGVRFLSDFSERYLHGDEPRIQILLDGRRSNAAQIVNGYLNVILQQFADEQSRAGTVVGAGSARAGRRGRPRVVQSEPRIPLVHRAEPGGHHHGADRVERHLHVHRAGAGDGHV